MAWRISHITINRSEIRNSVARYKFNEIVGYSAGINGQKWLPVWQRVARHGIRSRATRSLHPRSISPPATANLQIFKSCGSILWYHTRENLIRPADETHIYFVHGMWAATFLNVENSSPWHKFLFPPKDLIRNLSRAKSFSQRGEVYENEKLFVIRLIVGALMEK